MKLSLKNVSFKTSMTITDSVKENCFESVCTGGPSVDKGNVIGQNIRGVLVGHFDVPKRGLRGKF